MIRAAVDIGSNTVRVLVAELLDGGLRRLGIRRKITRLSGGFQKVLAPEAASRTLEVAGEFIHFAEEHEPDEIRVACTGVLRRASNREEFLDRFSPEFGLFPALLDGDEEAFLGALGARHGLGGDFPPFILADVGGFSTELSVIGPTVGRRLSLDVGVVTMTETFFSLDPPTAGQVEEARDFLGKEFEDFFRAPTPGRLVGIAGTPTTIAAVDLGLDVFDPEKVHRHAVGAESLDGMLDKMLSMTAKERLAAFPALEKGREDLMPAGILVFQEIMRLGGYSSLTVSEGGLLEGILLAPAWPPSSLAAASVAEVG